MGSLNHGLTQGKLIVNLSNNKKFTVIPELSLDISQIDLSRFKINLLIRKIKVYFYLGIKSSWLVIPALTIINVYSKHNSYKTFDLNDTELVDEVMDIHLPIRNI